MAKSEISESRTDRHNLREGMHAIEKSGTALEVEIGGLHREMGEIKAGMIVMNGKIDEILKTMPKRSDNGMNGRKKK